MYELGTAGVAAVKARVSAALGPNDSPAKPLTKPYAIYKTRMGKGNRRNLTLTGAMLQNLLVRTVSENRARAGFSTRSDRLKAMVNQRIEPWLVFSPRNRAAVLDAARKMLGRMKSTLVLERALGGRQQ